MSIVRYKFMLGNIIWKRIVCFKRSPRKLLIEPSQKKSKKFYLYLIILASVYEIYPLLKIKL